MKKGRPSRGPYIRPCKYCGEIFKPVGKFCKVCHNCKIKHEKERLRKAIETKNGRTNKI